MCVCIYKEPEKEYMCVCIYVCVYKGPEKEYMCVYIYTYMYIYIFKESEK